MKKLTLLTILIIISFQGFSQITFTALVNHFKEGGEPIQSHLMDNGFTFIKKDKSSGNDYVETWALNYNQELSTAVIWVYVDFMLGYITEIEIESYDHPIHNYLKERIIKYCKYEGLFQNINGVYKKDYVYQSSELKYQITFTTYSKTGTNYIKLLYVSKQPNDE